MKIYLSSEEQQYTHSMENNRISIGRSEANDFQVPVDQLSKIHCDLMIENEKIFIRDLGSKNGVYIDGVKIPPHEKFEINHESVINITKKLLLSLKKPPGQTHLGVTGFIEIQNPQSSPAKIRGLKK